MSTTLLVRKQILSKLLCNVKNHHDSTTVCNTVVLFDEDIPLVESISKEMKIPNTVICTKKNKYGIAVYLQTKLEVGY